MFDFLTSYNGLGLAINKQGDIDTKLIEELFDLNSFIEAAAYCDEPLQPPNQTDANGNIIKLKARPRFTFNMIFDSQTSARNLMDEIYRCCRGGLFIKNGRLQFKIDKKEPVSKIFNENDIIDGSEVFESIPREENYEILKCSYISPQHEWQKVEATAEIPNYKTGVPMEHSINMFSVTNFYQASRLAWYYVNSKRLQPYFGSFKTGFKAADLEVGDVILFDSPLMGLKKYPVKITSITDEDAGIYELSWKNYDERLYTDEYGSKEPRILVSTIQDIAKTPDDVKNFNVVQSNNIFNCIWEYNQDTTNTYEIRVGENWENATTLKSGILENSYSTPINTKGIFKFWIKAFNGYNYSQNATLDIVNIDSIPNLNEIVKINILENPNGIFDDNIRIYRNTLKLKENILWENTETTWSNFENYYSNNIYWGASVPQQGCYESQIYDIGKNLNSFVSFDYKFISADKQNDIIIEWCYSEDGISYSDWKLINSGTYKFRYCKFKITMNAYNNVQTVLTDFMVSIDVPDKTVDMELEILTSEGLRIDYDFVQPPSIIATVNDTNNAYIVISEKTNSYAVIKAYTNEGNLTTCKLSLRAKGY